MSTLKGKIKLGLVTALAAAGFTMFWDGFYVTQEGTVSVVKTAGKVSRQTDPGFHFKVPLVESIITIDVRERKSREAMDVSTNEQMKAKGIVSINWSANKMAVSDLYIKYGGLEEFEEKILDPKLREAAKSSIAKFSAEENIVQRDKVTDEIRKYFTAKIKELPITVSAVQIEDIKFSDKYLESIDTKQTEKNLAEAEEFVLQKQNLKAQQAVNTANAEAESIKLKAIAEAESIELKGKAEAESIQAKAKALRNNPLIVELTKAQKWNGALPVTMMGSDTGVLMDIRK